MSKDTIYREDAITLCEKWRNRTNEHHDKNGWYIADALLNAIKELPSADRPQGEWETVGKNHPYKRCPFCKRVRAFTDTRFCDWCGARMKGADDE